MHAFRIVLFACILFAGSLFAQENQVFITENGRIDFVSDAPLEMIKAGSGELKAAIDLKNKTFIFVLDNASFEGFNSQLQQEHFHENYIETKKYPKTVFKGKIIEDPQRKKDETQTVRAKGILDLHGIQKERIISAEISYKDEIIYIKSDFSIFLDDHQIRIPKVVSRKIAPEIKVKVEATLSPNITSEKQQN
jgi:hypothetical protein